MDLVDLMTRGTDSSAAVLDRLEGILALHDDDDPAVQDEALERAVSLCRNHWGDYRSGLEALAERVEAGADDPVIGSMQALRLREEAEDPGSLVRAARRRREEALRAGGARAAVIARYGSLEAALAPTALERLFIDAAAHLGDEADPLAPLAGWGLPWHPLPDELRAAVIEACPLPLSVVDARDEALSWEDRRRELAALSDGPGEAILPTACAARARVVDELWARGLAARTPRDLIARLEYWATRGGDDGSGYAVALEDLRRLASADALSRPERTGSTREAALRLKAEHPDWSLARIGKELGISRQAVHKHLRKAN